MRRINEVLEWYAEATPAMRLNDGGKRAKDLMLDLNDDDGDKLERLTDNVNVMIKEADSREITDAEDEAINKLRALMMELSD